MHDVPLCNAISANVVVEGLSFYDAAGWGHLSLPQHHTRLLQLQIKLNLQDGRDFSTILYEFPVRAGSDHQADLEFWSSGAVGSHSTPTLSPPIHVFSVNLTRPKPIITLNPVITINANQANVIDMDFNVLGTLGTNSTGNLTGGKLRGQYHAIAERRAIGSYESQWIGEQTTCGDFVRSVTTTNKTSNPTYTGSFEMQLLSPSTADAPGF